MNLRFIQVVFSKLRDEVQTYMISIHDKAGEVFSAASPYGQLLQAIEKIFENSIQYLKNTIQQFDIWNPEAVNIRMVQTMALLAGYNPSRGISATGSIKLQLKPGIAILDEIPGGEMTILNNTRLRNKTNGRDYFIDLGTDRVTYKLESNGSYVLNIVQGVKEQVPFTGLGSQNQSISVNVPTGTSVDNFRYNVYVNGQYWSRKDNMYDMLPNELSYHSRTGFTGGIEIWFGTGNFGAIPPLGSQILVEYVLTDGSVGNISNKKPNDWTFVDDIFDSYSGTIDMDQMFFSFIEHEINFGSNGESVDFIKAAMPYVSRNFVLARPEQYVFHLKRLNVFSQIDAYTTEKGTKMDNGDPNDDGVVYIFLIPDFRLQLANADDYFTIDEGAFYLDTIEKGKVIKYLKSQGTLGLGTSIKIIDPKVAKYVLYVHIRIYDDVIEQNVRHEILSSLSNYFVETTRRDRIPLSDLTKVVEEVDGIDSVNIKIYSEANEKYHGDFEIYKKSVLQANPTADPSKITKPGYNPKLVVGLDPKFGDIVLDKDQLAIIRGGWKFRNGLFHNQTPTATGVGSVNIIIEGKTKRKTF